MFVLCLAQFIFVQRLSYTVNSKICQRGEGGYTMDVLVGVFGSVLQTLTLFQTKNLKFFGTLPSPAKPSSILSIVP